MPKLKNPGKFPPAGWKFSQIEIGWKAPMPMSEGLDTLTDRVLQLRLNNPVLQRLNLPTDKSLIRQEIVNYNCAKNPAICVDPEKNATNTVTRERPRTGGGCCGKSK